MYRYWYPLTHFLSLAFTPTAVVGLNIALDMPKVEFRSNARPSTYAYPPPLEEKKDKSKEKVETAILSTTARQKKKEAEKKKDEKMEVVSATDCKCFIKLESTRGVQALLPRLTKRKKLSQKKLWNFLWFSLIQNMM